MTGLLFSRLSRGGKAGTRRSADALHSFGLVAGGVSMSADIGRLVSQ